MTGYPDKYRLHPVVQDPDRDCPTPSWAEALKLMSQSNFLFNLLNFNKDLINDETIELLEPYFRMEDYSLENAKKVCGNVAGLIAWTKAMAAFYSVNKEVIPLKMNLAAAKASFRHKKYLLCILFPSFRSLVLLENVFRSLLSEEENKSPKHIFSRGFEFN